MCFKESSIFARLTASLERGIFDGDRELAEERSIFARLNASLDIRKAYRFLERGIFDGD